MKIIVVGLVMVFAAVTMLSVQFGIAPVLADSTSGETLSPHMADLHRQVHKLGLSIDAQNGELADFYIKELGETITYVAGKFPEYDGHKVGALMPVMLNPYLTPLGKAIAAADWKAASPAYDTLIASGCNGCHMATQHAFIKIERNKANPYGQSFKGQ